MRRKRQTHLAVTQPLVIALTGWQALSRTQRGHVYDYWEQEIKDQRSNIRAGIDPDFARSWIHENQTAIKLLKAAEKVKL